MYFLGNKYVAEVYGMWKGGTTTNHGSVVSEEPYLVTLQRMGPSQQSASGSAGCKTDAKT